MFINNFMKAASIEAVTNRNVRYLSRYVDHSMFARLRIQLGTIKKLNDKGIYELPVDEFRKTFNLPAPVINNVDVILKPACACDGEKEKQAEDTTTGKNEVNRDSRRHGRDKDKKDPDIRVQIVKHVADRKDKVLIPDKRNLVKESDLWTGISLAIEEHSIGSYGHLKEHIEERILDELTYSIGQSDTQIIRNIAAMMARVSMMA